MISLRCRINFCFLLAAILIILANFAWAKPVDEDTAFSVAKAWLTGNQAKATGALGSSVLSTKGIRPFKNADGVVLAYIVDLNPKGFIVVPADDLVEPILTYGTEGNFSGELGGEHILSSMLLQDIPARIKNSQNVGAASVGKTKYARKVAQRWAKFTAASTPKGLLEMKAGVIPVGAVTPVVNPIIEDLWDQTSGNGENGPWTYEYYTPNHYLTGCVATALGMIIHHFKYPASASGSNTIMVDNQPQQANFDSTYNYDLMPTRLYTNSPENQRQEVSKLLTDCGTAVGMSYSANFSGAQMTGVYESLKNIFQYTSADLKSGEDND